MYLTKYQLIYFLLCKIFPYNFTKNITSSISIIDIVKKNNKNYS